MYRRQEYCLGIHVAALGDGTAGGVSLGNEYAGFGFLVFAFTVTQVVAAVAQLAVVPSDLLCLCTVS